MQEKQMEYKERVVKKIVIISACFSASLLCSCSSIVNGTKQNIMIETTPATQAHCILENDKGQWRVNSTPGQVLVKRSEKNLLVTCDKDGYDKKSDSFKSQTPKAVYGNIMAGGLIGAGIDRSSGAAFEYPSVIKMPLSAHKKH